MDLKLEVGENVTELGKMFLYLIAAMMIGSAIFMTVVLLYFMVLNPI